MKNNKWLVIIVFLLVFLQRGARLPRLPLRRLPLLRLTGGSSPAAVTVLRESVMR